VTRRRLWHSKFLLPTARVFDRLPSFFVAIGLVAVATTLRVAADPWLGVSVPYLFFYPAIMIAAILGGLGPGVLATFLSAFISVFLYLAPTGSMTVRDTGDIVALVLFVANGILMSRVGGIARRAAVREQELAAIVQSSDDAIIGKDLDGMIRTHADHARRHCGRGSGAPSNASSESGSMRASFARTAQCRCGPVTRPVAPTWPTTVPAETTSPSRASMTERCASIENNPRPWSMMTVLPVKYSARATAMRPAFGAWTGVPAGLRKSAPPCGVRGLPL